MTTVQQDNGLPWTPSDAADLYEVSRWGKGYFSVDDSGRVCVHPDKDPRRSIALEPLVERLAAEGVALPVLLRFGDIVKHRLGELQAAFGRAIDEYGYRGDYRCIYPIKVNQQRQVVEEVLRFGAPYRFGLEAGSKGELLAVVAMATNQTPIVCNGFKDDEFIEIATLAAKIGRPIFPVVEKYTELEAILRHAARLGVRPTIGMRVKLASPGAGRWQSSGGYRSKFGLTVSELLGALDELTARGMADCFKLLHFHLGSQITNIRHIKGALIEAARVYTDLARRGAGLEYLDVGGGLGVDYDGSQTNFESSANYTLQEYANDVVYHIQNVCDDAGVAHPTIFSESGRAVVAYHSVLVFDVLGVSRPGDERTPLDVAADAEQPLVTLAETFRDLNVRNLLESYHDAQQALDMALNLFRGGYLPLEQRSQAENLFWAICRKIRRLMRSLELIPEELEGIDGLLSETYFCNFSLFQSMPDSWAVKQLFPVMPIHRLKERPTQRAILADVTCDSDGKIDRFVDRRDVQRTLPLHRLDDGPYYLAAFLVGAYQEILGDMHNLFGDANAVHVRIDAEKGIVVDTVVAGDTIGEMLRYVEFDPAELSQRMRQAVEQALAERRIDDESAQRMIGQFERSIEGYTYLRNVREPRGEEEPSPGSHAGPHFRESATRTAGKRAGAD